MDDIDAGTKAKMKADASREEARAMEDEADLWDELKADAKELKYAMLNHGSLPDLDGIAIASLYTDGQAPAPAHKSGHVVVGN